MELNRRDLLKGALFTGVAAGTSAPGEAAELFDRPAREMPPEAVGMLYDSALCIGCRACVDACKEANGMPVEMPVKFNGWNEGTWDTPEDLSGKTLNIIKAYRNGTMAQKDHEIDGYAFVKRHCLHCVDPSCVSVCPVSAMQKDPVTGIVTHNPDACIGCRYCVYGCPFGVPQYQLDEAFGQIAKCQMCSHLQEKGQVPACCDVCPTGASLFGPVKVLQEEADKRLTLKAGSSYQYPRGDIRLDRPKNPGTVPHYISGVYGRTESGGTQVQYLAAVPFVKLGLPKLPSRAYARVSEGIQHTLYKHMIAPAALLAGLVVLAWRGARKSGEDATESARSTEGDVS